MRYVKILSHRKAQKLQKENPKEATILTFPTNPFCGFCAFL